MTLWVRLVQWWRDVQEPLDVFDSDFPAADMECPDTHPTSPGALDSDLGELR